MATALALGIAGNARAAEYAPVFNAQVLGGQYFFQGSNGNVSGNVTVNAAEAVKLDERWSLVPMYAGGYQGTKGVNDQVAAGTLFQQAADQRVSLTGIYSPEGSNWKLRPQGSYKYEFLKETRDETWTHGLFDYEKIGAGFEAENVYNDPFSYKVGFDFYRIRFPNFQSLESQAPNDPLGNPLARGKSNQNVLDTYNYQLSVGGSRPFPYNDPIVSLSAGYSFTWQEYLDQSVVDSKGQLTDHRPYSRRDFMQALNAAVGYPVPVRLFGREVRLDSSLGGSFAYNGSNQNLFDAAATQFFFDAYSYTSWGFGPGVSLSWGDKKRPSSAGLSFNYVSTKYMGRQAENGDGLYTGEHQWQDRYQVTLKYGVPISPGFYLRGSANFLWARSNNTFEKTYAYNYRTANYLMGFSYEY
ncbi:MAG: hypothetical protein HY077_07110 [Elusimicrobia bacterium]|nr:hypothetical protein [Elusimicrobiota bacterium]